MSLRAATTADAQQAGTLLLTEIKKVPQFAHLYDWPWPSLIERALLGGDRIWMDDGTGPAGAERVLIWLNVRMAPVRGNVQWLVGPSAIHGGLILRFCDLVIAAGWGDINFSYYRSTPQMPSPLADLCDAKCTLVSERDPTGRRVTTTANKALARGLANGLVRPAGL